MFSNSIYTDKELFKLISGGDEAAFETLFHRYAPKILPVLTGLVHSEVVARDLVQDIFLSIWISRHKLTEIEGPHNWIFRIVYNRDLDSTQLNTRFPQNFPIDPQGKIVGRDLRGDALDKKLDELLN